jgi:hypothetical protein
MKHIAALTLTLLTACAVNLASAQTSGQTDQPVKRGPGGNGPCKADVEKLCPNVQPGGGRIIACMKENKDKLSEACKAALEKHRAGGSGNPGADAAKN